MNIYLHPSLTLAVVLVSGATLAGTTIAEPSTPGALRTMDMYHGVVELPLRHTDVNVEITSFVARTTVEQLFDNPFDHPIEVTYTFPLGDEAAVDDFEMHCGSQIIRGEIHRREEARRIYEEARDEGYQAALLEQQRPNIFVQTIANLMPGDEIRIRIRTVELLEYTDGVYQYVFPLVVGPRYNPGADPAAARPDPAVVPRRLKAGQRSGHDVAVHVEIDAGVPLDDVVSPNQTIYVSRTHPTKAVVDLAEASSIPNKDFVLRWNVGSQRPALGTLTHRSGDEGFFTILVQPKGTIEAGEAAPRDVVMVLDTSGSMGGLPIEMSKRFVRDALRSLGSRDRFNLVRFAGASKTFSTHLLPNDPHEIQRAEQWIEKLTGGGGTEMLRGLKKALEIEGEEGRFRQIIFLTDGFIGNESEIIEAVSRLPEAYRVFTIGIGSSVNHFLLDRMAEVGGGAFTFIPDDNDHWRALERFEKWVTRPYLTDIEFDWGGLPIRDLVPDRPMDLFSGHNLYLIGRYDHAAEGTITARGYLGGEYWEQVLPVVFPDRDGSHAALTSVWARHRIKALLLPGSDLSQPEVRERVTDLALRYRLMSPYTSFVAVDYSSRANSTGSWDHVEQAVPLPLGVAEEMAEEVEVYPAMLAKLSTGQTVTERVRVAAKSDVVDLNETSQTTRFTDEFIQDLPVPGRFYQNVLTLAPGVQDPGPGGGANVHGSRHRDFEVAVGGVSNVDPLVGRVITSVSTNSIAEMEIIKAGAGVQFSRAQGGFARIIQKQGSNTLEGVFEIRYGSHAFDGNARDADLAFDGYRAGFLLSGPLIKDRLWFRMAHDGTRRDDPVNTTASIEAIPTQASAHSDRLTWQVSPRNKLAFEFAREDLSMSRVGVSSWIGPDSASSITSGGPRYALTWTMPLSPKALVETVLAYQNRSYETRADRPEATNNCVAEPDAELSGLHCLDLIAHGVTGPAYLNREQDDRRVSLQVDATIYAGRWIGADHQLEFGAVIEDEEFGRRMKRGSTLIRTVDDDGTRELLVARVAAPSIHESDAATAYWGLYAEDRIKPASNLAVTVGLRLERTELRGRGFALPSPDVAVDAGWTRRPEDLAIADMRLAPFVGVSWDPWSRGETKLWLSARRYHGRLHPGIATIESEPVTFDAIVSNGSGPTGDPAQEAPRPNVQIVDRDLRAPHQDEWTAGFEHEILAETKLVFRLIDRRYRNQLGHEDLNHVGDDAGLGEQGSLAVLDPAWGEVLLVGNLESMDYRALVLEWIRRQYRSWEMQASYTYSELEGTAAQFDALAGDERNRIEVTPGHQAGDQRHLFTVRATSITPWGFRLGGALRWESGLPFSLLENGLAYRGLPGDVVPVPRLFYPTDRRNDQRNASMWTVDAKIARDINAGNRLVIKLSLEVFNLFDDDTYLVYNEARGDGMRIDAVDEAMRRAGRRVQLGITLSF